MPEKNSKKNSSRAGMALVSTLIVVLILLILGSAVFHKATLHGLGAIREIKKTELFWRAQQGLETAAVRFYAKKFSDYSPANNLFEIKVTNNYKGVSDQYLVSSTAVGSGGFEVTLQEVFKVTMSTISGGGPDAPLVLFNKSGGTSPFTLYATSPFSLKGVGEDDSKAIIYGDIGYYSADLGGVTLYIDAVGALNGTGAAFGEQVVANGADQAYDGTVFDPVYTKMTEIETAIDNASGPVADYTNWKNTTFTIDEGSSLQLPVSWGNTTQNSAKLTIKGDGTLVIPGDLSLGAELVISGNATLVVKGDLYVNNKLTVKNDGEVFVGGVATLNPNVSMSASGKHVIYGGEGVVVNSGGLPKFSGTILTPKDVLIAGDTKMTKTFLFADGEVKNTSPFDFEGVLYANQFWMANTAELTLDSKKAYMHNLWIGNLFSGGGGGGTTSVTVKTVERSGFAKKEKASGGNGNS